MARWSARIPGGFIDLIRRLGIAIPPGQDVPFELTGNVLPVAIVDAPNINAVTVAPILGIPASAGELIAPAANTRLADTGGQAFGDYNFTLVVSSADGNSYRVRRRNAADAADIWSSRIFTLGSTTYQWNSRFHLELNERVVIENVTAGVGTYQASVWLTA